MELIEVKAQLEQEANAFIEPIAMADIATPEEEADVVALMQECKRRQKVVMEHLEPHKKAAYATYKGIMATIDKLVAPYEALHGKLSLLIITYRKKLAEERAIAQKKAEEEARKRAEEDRLAAAVAAEQAGAPEMAEMILAGETIPVAPVIVPEPQKAAGVQVVELWRAEVVDVMALVKAVAIGAAPLDAITPNMVWLNKAAQTMKDQLRIPGVTPVATAHTRTMKGGE